MNEDKVVASKLEVEIADRVIGKYANPHVLDEVQLASVRYMMREAIREAISLTRKETQPYVEALEILEESHVGHCFGETCFPCPTKMLTDCRRLSDSSGTPTVEDLVSNITPENTHEEQ